MKKNWLLLFMMLVVSISLWAKPSKKVTKVACVGNSITYGYLLPNREVEAYPSQLQQLLGSDYEVGNFGKSGATLINKAYRPYTKQEEYKQALSFKADIVVIKLGVNDTDPRSWPNYQDDFIGDYLSLINDFRIANPKCKVYICRLTPVSRQHPRFLSGTRDWFWQVQQQIERVAKIAKAQLIDLYSPLSAHPNLFPDALHPNAEGAKIIAKTVYQHLTGKFGGLQMPITYTNNMVLQRGIELPIKGIANAGDAVKVVLGTQQQQTVADANGKWQVTFPAQKAASNLTLTIQTKTQRLVYTNVAVGEVWLCSGQSNMAFMVKELIKHEKDILLNYAKTQPNVHLFDMKPYWYTDNKEWDLTTLDSINRLIYYQPTQWQMANATTVNEFSAIAMAFGKLLSDSLKVPVGLICNAIGGSDMVSWVDRGTLQRDMPAILVDWKANDFLQEWVRERAKYNIAQSQDPFQRHPYEPAFLYETGIESLKQYPIKGVLWYQGESDAHNPEAFAYLFELLTHSWRQNWHKELPFYFVQLSSLNRPSWSLIRDIQRCMATEIPKTYMAVSSDRGDSLNVHPNRKIEVGQRLAFEALRNEYRYKEVATGQFKIVPSFKNHEVLLTFEKADGLKTSDGAPIRTFELAGEEGIYYPAQAEIQGTSVRVWSNDVEKPLAVRYGWQPYTTANLISAAGFPVSTFRFFENEQGEFVNSLDNIDLHYAPY